MILDISLSSHFNCNLIVVLFSLAKDHYKAYVGERCAGFDIKKFYSDSIKSCVDECDALPDCVGFTYIDDASWGACWIKKDPCLDNITPGEGVTLFLKPSMYLCW